MRHGPDLQYEKQIQIFNNCEVADCGHWNHDFYISEYLDLESVNLNGCFSQQKTFSKNNSDFSLILLSFNESMELDC